MKIAISKNAVIHSISAAGVFGSTGVPTETGHSCRSLGFSLQILMFKQTSLGGKNQIFKYL